MITVLWLTSCTKTAPTFAHPIESDLLPTRTNHTLIFHVHGKILTLNFPGAQSLTAIQGPFWTNTVAWPKPAGIRSTPNAPSKSNWKIQKPRALSSAPRGAKLSLLLTQKKILPRSSCSHTWQIMTLWQQSSWNATWYNTSCLTPEPYQISFPA